MALFSRKPSDDSKRLRKDRTGMSTLKAGAILIGLLVVITWLGFTKDIPFTHGYRVKAVFPSANSIRTNSPVRIAGVNVGKVKSVSRYKDTNASLIEMELKNNALPIHKDATLKIRPRIFLEGNFFVDLHPGTSASPTLDSGSTVPITQASNSVQLDELLTSLQSDTRENLKTLLRELGNTLTRKPTAIDDLTQDPIVRGETAAKSLNDTYRYAPTAEKSIALVNKATLGTEPHDLSKLVASFGKVSAALDRNESSLKDLITNFNITVGALASQDTNLRASIRELAPTLRSANAALTSLNNAFPATRAFAREILPGVRETPATINASFPWITQTRLLLGRKELRGLAQELRPTSANLARLTDQTIKLLPQIDRINRCVTNVILPTGDIVVQDGALTSGKENYKEFWYTLVGLAGEGQNFDGNGMYVRFQVGGGTQTVSTGAGSLSGEVQFGNAIDKPIGTRPRYTGKRPPYRPEVPCYTQALPNVNGSPLSNTGAVERVVASDTRSRSTPAEQGGTSPRTGGTNAGGGSVADELVKRLNPFLGVKAP